MSAQSIEHAREQWFSAEFEAACEGFEAVLASAGLTTARATDAHRYLAVLYMLLGDDEKSRDHADAAVALSVDIEPPEGSPPEAVDLFRMARRRLGNRAAALRIESVGSLRLDLPGRIVARLEPSPPALASELWVRCGTEEARGAPPSVELRLEPDGELRCSVDALSAGGGVLLTLDRALLVEGLEEEGPLAGDSRELDGGRKKWPWIVGTSAVVVAAGVVLGVLLFRSDGDGARFGNATITGW